RDYDYLTSDAEALIAKLERLTDLRGHDTIDAWSALARAGDWRALVAALLAQHYDPLYRRSQQYNFARHPDAPIFEAERLDAAGIDALAVQIIRHTVQGSRDEVSARTAQMR
ncbi:MAG: tRNA 2-selenouridine(34) synthase MnmH, partial [Methyloversatilis sp. 12-65-5]